MSFYPNKTTQRDINQSEDEQGQIRSEQSSSDSQQNQLQQGQLQQRQIQQGDDQIYDSQSSDDDKARVQQQKKKREDFWKTINLHKPEVPQNSINLFQYALQAASKTNKKMLMLRKKNAKRIQQLENMRMIQQPPLMAGNTHFRSSLNEYPLITIDYSGKKYYHPNTSLKVMQCRLEQFIQKNISEEGTSNYLNQVVKFQNFAYQHRKKRKQNFQ